MLEREYLFMGDELESGCEQVVNILPSRECWKCSKNVGMLKRSEFQSIKWVGRKANSMAMAVSVLES